MLRPEHHHAPVTNPAPANEAQAPCGAMDPTRAAADFVAAQEAVGATFGEALGGAATLFGPETVKPQWDTFIEGCPAGFPGVDVLNEVAQVAPCVANAWLGDALSRGTLRSWDEDCVNLGIHLDGCPWVTDLPDGLDVDGMCWLKDCVALSRIGPPMGDTRHRGMMVGTSLGLGGCVRLESLPDGLQVGGSLDLNDCVSLKALPRRLVVGEDLLLLRCRNLETLPDDLQVAEDVDLTGCTALRRLPDTFRVKHSLYMNDCSSITHLPAGLYVGGHCWMAKCVNLQALPGGMKVYGKLGLRGCTSLRSLPEGLHVGEDIELEACTALSELPRGLKVGGSLDLSDCTSLTRLPEGLEVDGDLYMVNCTAWDGRIPDDARVHGRICTPDHPGGIRLAEWRAIYLLECQSKTERT